MSIKYGKPTCVCVSCMKEIKFYRFGMTYCKGIDNILFYGELTLEITLN